MNIDQGAIISKMFAELSSGMKPLQLQDPRNLTKTNNREYTCNEVKP